MFPQRVAVVGAGGLGRETEWLIHECGPTVEFGGFFVSGPEHVLPGVRLLEDLTCLLDRGEITSVVVAVGDPRLRRSLVERVECLFPEVRWATLIHPTVRWDKSSSSVGRGSILLPGVVLTTGVTVGDHCVINPNATVGHDVEIGCYCVISPGARIAGFVHIGEDTQVGIGSAVLQGLRIGARARVGGLACVTRDVAEDTTVVGVPARVRLE